MVVVLATTQELRAIEEAHRAAQARLGIAGAYLAVREWEGTSAVNVSASAGNWLQRSMRMINAIRRKSRRLARAYYQTARALELGITLGIPEDSDDPDQITMGGLRQQYLDLLIEIATIDTEPSESDDPDEEWFESQLREVDLPEEGEPLAEDQEADQDPNQTSRPVEGVAPSIDSYIQDLLDAYDSTDVPDTTAIEVDEYDWGDYESAEDVHEAFDRIFEQELLVKADEKVQRIRDGEGTPGEVLDKVEEEHENSGRLMAGRVDRYGIQSGRDLLNQATRNDRRIKAVARGVGPNPCAFCAMLASRGFVYGSETGAVLTGLGDSIRSYHDNCHCYPIVRWVDADELPEMNAYFQEQWPIVTAGYSGVDALNAWRRWLNGQRREQLKALRAGQQ